MSFMFKRKIFRFKENGKGDSHLSTRTRDTEPFLALALLLGQFSEFFLRPAGIYAVVSSESAYSLEGQLRVTLQSRPDCTSSHVTRTSEEETPINVASM